MNGSAPKFLSASTIEKDKVEDLNGEDIGHIEELMIDLDFGTVAYAALSFKDKLFAVPWEALSLKEGEHRFVFHHDRSLLEESEGFDRGNWPLSNERKWLTDVYSKYGFAPYWEK